MPLHSSEAYLLDVYDLHEYDCIVTLLTRDFGKRRGVAQGARRRFSRFAGQLQPLDKVRVTWFEKDGRDLDRLSSMETVRSAKALGKDLEGILINAYLAEQMSEFAQESEEDDHLFRLLDVTVGAMLEGVDRSLAARYFEAWLLRLSGLFPEPISCPVCRRSLSGDGATLAPSQDAIVCRECGSGGTPISSAALDFFRRISRNSPKAIAGSPPPASILVECEDLCARIRGAFLQHELKSRRVMRETLAGLADRGR